MRVANQLNWHFHNALSIPKVKHFRFRIQPETQNLAKTPPYLRLSVLLKVKWHGPRLGPCRSVPSVQVHPSVRSSPSIHPSIHPSIRLSKSLPASVHPILSVCPSRSVRLYKSACLSVQVCPSRSVHPFKSIHPSRSIRPSCRTGPSRSVQVVCLSPSIRPSAHQSTPGCLS